MEAISAPWPTEWLRGALHVCVLHVIADGPTYGYAIASALADAGLGPVKGGTLYPLLARLEEADLVTVEWRAGDGGPGRKFYALTDAGRVEHDRQTAHWRSFADLTSTFISTPTIAPASGKDPS
ncbi:PadR family transcriptional regulator, regulatory protein PadR [Nocardioides alpinus]|uniref:PadR family transcriptional regulator n=1 Tax=Nocardioides alpinus TaxID=748909 RepID=A0A1I1AWL0_9ACTN|nr:PadR family transcriptional regulator [Nocardioides alpinus]PKH40312.1 PadR family transcriptional regulator [Nocardioides alpinus]SFB40730.1 PadR family transcriptional regulator, regulatory protein PadR [Nocardioides alpinus]